MADNTHDTDAQLIETLRGLTPTKGEWEVDRRPHSPANIIMGIVAEKGNDDGDWVVSVASHGIRVEADTLALILAAPAMRALILRQADELAALKTQLAAADQPAPTEWVSGESKPCPDCERLGERARSLSGWNKPAPRLSGDGPL